jgi:drug/metabolite transporter (DMT)-like permease
VNAGPLARSPRVDRVGLISLFIGTAIIAWSGVLARFLDIGPVAGGAWRMALAAPVLAVWASLASGRKLSLARPAAFALPLIFAGLAFATDVASFHLALTGTKVANAAFIGNVTPILAVAGGALFFAEHPPPRVWFALVLALFGSWIMAGMGALYELGYGDLLALLAAAAYASYLLIIKRVRVGLDGPTATLWSAIVSAIALAIAAALRGETLVPHTPLGWTIVVLLGIVSHAMGQGLTSVAIGRVPVGLVALVILAPPPFSALIAWLVLGEIMSPLQMIGGAVILAAVLLARPK